MILQNQSDDGELGRLTPDQLIDRLGRFRHPVLPVGIIRELIRRGPSAGPAMLRSLRRVFDEHPPTLQPRHPSAFFQFYCLGAADRDEVRSFLTDLFRSGDKTMDLCCGEITSSEVPAIIAHVADPDEPERFPRWADEMFADERVDEYAKSQIHRAMWALVGRGTLPDSVAAKHAIEWTESRSGRRYDLTSSMLVAEWVDVGGGELRSVALEAFDRGQIDDDYVDRESLERIPPERCEPWLKKQAAEFDRTLADPTAKLSGWFAFSWTTDDANPVTATLRPIPSNPSPFEREIDEDVVADWLHQIERSDRDDCPLDAIRSLDYRTDRALEGLSELVRRGVRRAAADESCDTNGPFVAALLLSRNANNDRSLLTDPRPLVDVFDLPVRARHRWFGMRIARHLTAALTHIHAGDPAPMLRCIRQSDRDANDRLAATLTLPLSVHFGYRTIAEAADDLDRLWREFETRADADGSAPDVDADAGLMLSAIHDAACLLSLDDSHPIIVAAERRDVGPWPFNPEDTRRHRESPEVAEKALAEFFSLGPQANLESELMDGFEIDAIYPRRRAASLPPNDPVANRPAETVRNDIPRVGRNAACPCGSGKKFKKCCGRN